MLEKRIRILLNDIIDTAFSDKTPEERRRYKSFKLSISPAEKKNSSGVYKPQEKKIEVYNPSLGAKHLAKCCLHELSHHIDCEINGVSGHQKPFYAVYTRLIYASLDMGILSKDDFKDIWSSDRNKVWAIVESYTPRPVKYSMPKTPYVSVFNSFFVKNELKEKGYRYNKLEQTWEKDVEDLDKEKDFLKNIGVEDKKQDKAPYYLVKNTGMLVDGVVYIEASGDSYSVKEELKKAGFFFKKEKKTWVKKTLASEKDAVLSELESNKSFKKIDFKVMSRK